MISENLVVLIEKLKKKTIDGQAKWTKTSADNEFKLELSKGAITIDNWPSTNFGYMFVDIVVINDNGDVIERAAFTDEEDLEDYNKVLDLHKEVSKSYYKVDETIKTIFDELDSDKIVGKGNLPF